MPGVLGYAQPAGLFHPDWGNWVTPGAPIGLKGLLAKQFDPKELRYQAGSNALLQAGLAMMNPDPRLPPQGLLGMIGRGFAGAAQGAEAGKENFYNEGMRNVQLSQLQKEQDAQDAQSAALNALIPTLPPDVQSFARAYPQQFGEAYLKAKMGSEPYTLGKDQVRMGPDNKPLAYGPTGDDPSKYTQVTLEDGVYRVNMQTGEKVKIGDRPNRNEGEGRDFQQENKLRQSYLDEVKPFAQSRQMYQRMRAAYEGTKTDNTGASDIAMVFSYMKMLDPTSVVREGEQATAQSAGGVPSQIVVMYNKLLTGERLSPQVRDSFMKQSEMQFQQQEQSYKQTRQTYKNLATQYQLDPERTAPDISYGVQSGKSNAPDGVPQELWDEMTPEERSHWQN